MLLLCSGVVNTEAYQPSSYIKQYLSEHETGSSSEHPICKTESGRFLNRQSNFYAYQRQFVYIVLWVLVKKLQNPKLTTLISAVSEIPTTYNCSPPLFCVQRILVGCAHRLVSTSEPKEWSACCCSLANCLWSSFKMGFEVIHYANTGFQRK